MSASFFCNANSLIEGYSEEEGVLKIIFRGILPKFRKNGVYPVLSDHAELIANSIAGSLATQSFWSG